MTGAYIEALLIFFGLIALFMGIGIALRGKGLKGLKPETPIKIISGLRLGTRERVVILEINQEWLVVGITPGGMQTLHTLPKPPENPSSPSPQDPVFSSWLKKLSLHRVS